LALWILLRFQWCAMGASWSLCEYLSFGRRELWAALKKVVDLLPLIVGGDFNVSLKHLRSEEVSLKKVMVFFDFREFVQGAGLRDMKFYGPQSRDATTDMVRLVLGSVSIGVLFQ